MRSGPASARRLAAALSLCLAGAVLADGFKKKECLDCHQKFAEKLRPAKDLHPGIKEQRCEDCHLRHGIVPKLLLKASGNDLCLGCHKKESIGLDKPNVHQVLKSGQCTQCHDPHGSPARMLLK